MSKKKPMRLNDLKKAVDEVYKRADGLNPEVEVWINENQMCRIVGMGQFSIVPDVTIDLGPVVLDLSKP